MAGPSLTVLRRKYESLTTSPKKSLFASLVRAIRRDRYLYLMFLPVFAYYITFHYAPMYGVTLAFRDFRIREGIFGGPWVGLKYFRQFFTNPYFWVLLRNTVYLRLYQLAVTFPAPIILALLLNELRNEKFKRVVQTCSYLPYFISTMVVAGMISNFLATDGLINSLLSTLGVTPRPWLLMPEWFRTIIVASDVWQAVGWSSIIYLAALSAINLELYEAAAMDGANRWQRMRYVTIPGITPTATILFLLALGSIVSVGFQKILLLYTGATYETADVLGTYIYRRGIEGADFSFATAVGFFQSVVGLVFIVGANALAKKVGDTSLW